MGSWFKKAFTAIGPRVIGVGASLLTGYIYAQTKGTVNIDPTQVVEIAGTMLGTYAVAHRAVSAVGVNPGDAASPTLAAVDSQIKEAAQKLPPDVVPTVPVVPLVPKPSTLGTVSQPPQGRGGF